MIPTEDDECKALVQYLELLQNQGHDIMFTHLANETYTKSWKQKNRNKAMGVRAGFPDYIFIINHKFFVIEMKRSKGGQLQPSQKEWISALKKADIPTYICKGFDAAREVIEGYLSPSPGRG